MSCMEDINAFDFVNLHVKLWNYIFEVIGDILTARLIQKDSSFGLALARDHVKMTGKQTSSIAAVPMCMNFSPDALTPCEL